MATELTVRGEAVQALYIRYRQDRFEINRRYQRKLVWAVEEKEKLIDSMLLNLPVPLFLVAETKVGADDRFEIIDGLQRLNATFSFIENEFSVGGEYFDLETLAETKNLADAKILIQQQPVMDRARCIEFSNYQLALSVFRYETPDVVDEAFRRINSGGRRLSPQELRQAGTLSPLADIVHQISSQVRGDTSPSDLIPLKKMPEISVSNRDLGYGVLADKVFWVRHGILRRDDLRLSQDEELVLDLVIDCLVDPLETSKRANRDTYYNYGRNEALNRGDEFSRAIKAYEPNMLIANFFEAHDALDSALPVRFATHIGLTGGGRAPRYWHAVFMAFFELMHKENLTIASEEGVAEALKGITRNVLNIPGGSGTWTLESKRQQVDAVKGVIRRHFEPRTDGHRGPRYGWKSEFQKILGNARVEQTFFECKQGILELGPIDKVAPSDEYIEKLQRTLTAMCNVRPNAEGFLMLGISDSPDDTRKIIERDHIVSSSCRGFDIVGVEREALRMGLTLHDYFERLVNLIASGKKMDQVVSRMIRSNARIINYEHHEVIVFSVESGEKPAPWGDAFYTREGSSTKQVPASEFSQLFSRFSR